MENHPTSPLQMLSNKRRNESSEEDLLSDMLSHLSVSKRVCQEHGRDQCQRRSTITAATGSIHLDTVAGSETSIQRPINKSSTHAPPKLERSEDKQCQKDQSAPEDTGAKSKPLRKRYAIRRVLHYVPVHRPSLVETNGCSLHPESMPVSKVYAALRMHINGCSG